MCYMRTWEMIQTSYCNLPSQHIVVLPRCLCFAAKGISTNEKPIELSKDKCSIISSRCLKMYGIAEVVVNAKGGSWYFSHVREWMRGSLAGDAKKNEDVPRLSGVDIRHVYRLHMRQENLCPLLEWGPNLSVRYAECAWHRSASFEIKCLSEQWTIVCSKTHVHVPNEIFCQAF